MVGILQCGDLERHIRESLARGRSPYSEGTVWRALWGGYLRLAIGERMSASAWVRDIPGVGPRLEVVHIGGEFNRSDWRFFERAIEALELELRLPVAWDGRLGWERFLRSRGVNNGRGRIEKLLEIGERDGDISGSTAFPH